MKKVFLLISVFIILILPMVFAYDIGYVIDGNSDENVIEILDDLGHSYGFIDGDDISGVNFLDYKMLLIGNDRMSDYADIPVGNVKSLVFNQQNSHLDEWGIADYANVLSSSNYEYANLFNHEISNGLSNSVKLYNTKNTQVSVLPYSLKDRASGLQKIAVSDTSNRIVVGAIEKGGKLYSGGIANERIVYFGIIESDSWTLESRQLFENSIDWLMDGEGNHAPVLISNIPDVELNIGESLIIDLDDYFYDEDNDDLVYSIEESPGNLDFVIDDNLVTISSIDEWVGEDFIKFKASDSEDFVLGNRVSLIVSDDSEPPETFELSIVSYTPESDFVKILDGEMQDFSIEVSDEGVDVDWFVDSGFGYFNVNTVTNSLIYFFNKDLGDYKLKVVASKQGFDDAEKIWDVSVNSIDEFTCSEVQGNICNVYQECSEDFLEVSDSASCCPVSCDDLLLEFNGIDREENITEDIELEIIDPDEDKEFNLGEIIKLRMRIENNVDDSFDVNVKAYLYDLTQDEITEEYESSVKMDKDSNRIFGMDLEIPYDIEEDDDYALFVQINDEDENYFNEDYVRIKLIRDARAIIIDRIEIPENIKCGNYLSVNFRVRNIGSETQDVYLKIENSALGIKEKTEVFELEEYDGKDSVAKTFSFKIPEVEKGVYGITINAYAGTERFSEEKKVTVDCNKVAQSNLDEIEVVELNGENSEAIVSKAFGINKMVLISSLVFTGVLVLALLGSFVYFRTFKKD